MNPALRYARHLVIWTGILTAFLALSGWGGHEVPWRLSARLPGILGFALALAGFPAGVAVGARVWGNRATAFRSLAALAAAALVVTSGVAVLNQVVAPRALAAGRNAPAPEADVRELTLAELRATGRDAAAAVRGLEPGDGELAAWQPVNRAAFEHDRRLAHAILPLLLTWIGLCVGFWIDRVPTPAARLPVALAVALGLLASIYLGGENGFEMVVMRVVGPAAFAAWFIPLAPAVLACGLGLPTVVSVWRDAGPRRS